MSDHYTEFRKRWNITTTEPEAFSKFKIGVLNAFKSSISPIYEPYLDSMFCRRAIITDQSWSIYSLSSICTSIEKAKNIQDIVCSIEIIIKVLIELEEFSKNRNTNMMNRYIQARESITRETNRLISILPINLTMKTEKDGSVVFYPSGAKLLDEKLINDVLDWMSEYPDAHKGFKFALEKYEKKIYQRNLLDDLRSSLELFLRAYLKNDKSLENQKEVLLKTLKEEGVSTEIRDMFWTLLNKYATYQNEYVKHDDAVKEQEIEFILYLTATFIRFLITLK